MSWSRSYVGVPPNVREKIIEIEASPSALPQAVKDALLFALNAPSQTQPLHLKTSGHVGTDYAQFTIELTSAIETV